MYYFKHLRLCLRGFIGTLGLIFLFLISGCGDDEPTPLIPVNSEQAQGIMVSNLALTLTFEAANSNEGSAFPGTSESPDSPRGTTPGEDLSLFQVYINALDTEDDRYFSSYEAMPDTVFLSPGRYVVYVQNRVFEDPAFDWPLYCGTSDTISIDRGIFQPVQVTAAACNTRVRVSYSDNVSSLFHSFSTTINTQDDRSLFYDQEEARFGYFESDQDLSIKVDLERTLTDGSNMTQTLTGVIPNVEAGQSFTVNVDVSLTDGGAIINLGLDNEWVEIPLDIGFGDNDGGQNGGNALAVNRTVVFDKNNVVGYYPPTAEGRKETLTIETSNGESASFNIYISRVQNELGQLIMTDLVGPSHTVEVPFYEIYGLGTIYSDYIYVTARAEFADGERTSSRSAILIGRPTVDDPVTGVRLEEPVFEDGFIFNETTNPEYFTDSHKLAVTVVKDLPEFDNIRHNTWSKQYSTAVPIGNNFRLNWQLPYLHNGIVEYNFTVDNSETPGARYTALRHFGILRKITNPNIIDAYKLGDDVAVGATNYLRASPGVITMAVWRSDSPTFDQNEAIFISDYTNNVEGRILDKNPPTSVGQTVYYHVRMAYGYGENAPKTNMVSIPYTVE